MLEGTPVCIDLVKHANSDILLISYLKCRGRLIGCPGVGHDSILVRDVTKPAPLLGRALPVAEQSCLRIQSVLQKFEKKKKNEARLVCEKVNFHVYKPQKRPLILTFLKLVSCYYAYYRLHK